MRSAPQQRVYRHFWLEILDPGADVQGAIVLMMNRVVIVTTKQPGTNPRVRKSATALSAAGMEVHVLYAYTASWADEADQHTFRDAQWRHRRIGGHPTQNRRLYFKSRLKSKIGELLHLREWELCPALNNYIQQLQSLEPDLVIGHNPGSLPILREWHRTTGGNIVFDAEDFHRGESYWVRVKQEATIVDYGRPDPASCFLP